METSQVEDASMNDKVVMVTNQSLDPTSIEQYIHSALEASATYVTNLAILDTYLARVSTFISTPPAQPSKDLIIKFLKPLSKLVSRVENAQSTYLSLRALNDSDLLAINNELPVDYMHVMVRLNDTISYVVAELVPALVQVHRMVCAGNSGLGISKTVPKNVAVELERLRFHDDIVVPWRTAFQVFYVNAGGIGGI